MEAACTLMALAVVGSAMALSEALCMDYGAVGILSVVLFYLLYDKRLLAAVAGCSALLLLGIEELPALFSVLLIVFYNGRRGRQNKYFFYGFYPGHLLLFWLIATYILI
jgi:hypothetical protein